MRGGAGAAGAAHCWGAAGPSTGVKHILLGIQALLDNPNPDDPAQAAAYRVYNENRSAYEARVREEARKQPAA